MGKILSVLELDMKIGQDDHKVAVYAVFKDLKRGDIFAIYSDNKDENKSTLHYASVHRKENNLVFLDVKNKADIIKEFTWKLLNNQEKDGFDIIDISSVLKAEIISSCELLLKDEYIDKLKEKTIVEEVVVVKKKKKIKMQKSTKIVLVGILLCLLIIVLFCIFNKDLLLGKSIEYECSNSYLDKVIGATKEEIQYFTFDLRGNLTSRTITINYVFDNKEEYREFVNEGQYYHFDKKFVKSSVDYNQDDNTNTLSIIENVVLDDYYNGDKIKEVIIDNMSKNNYVCINVSE